MLSGAGVITDACYAYAMSQSAVFFGLQNGNVCMYGNEKTNLVGLQTNDQCYMDCGSSKNTQTYYLNSNKAKCGSKTTASIFQIGHSGSPMSFFTDPVASLGK